MYIYKRIQMYIYISLQRSRDVVWKMRLSSGEPCWDWKAKMSSRHSSLLQLKESITSTRSSENFTGGYCGYEDFGLSWRKKLLTMSAFGFYKFTWESTYQETCIPLKWYVGAAPVLQVGFHILRTTRGVSYATNMYPACSSFFPHF